MITTTRYKVVFDRTKGLYTIDNMDVPLCPDCGQKLSGYDRRLRHMIDSSGEVRWFSLRRLRCQKCHRLHLEVPDFIQSKKHYDVRVIKDVLNDHMESCPADIRTIKRWKKEYPPGSPFLDESGVISSTYIDKKGE
jgi:NAD-dependent SIR2 family protein deacetylase